jgi:hypothetical protein
MVELDDIRIGGVSNFRSYSVGGSVPIFPSIVTEVGKQRYGKATIH